MSVIAKQSTARTVMVGPILDADGVAVTGAVVGDLKISKNGGAPGALNGSATLTHRATGHYSLALTASDLDTVGQAEVIIDDTTNAMPVKVITVIEEAVYDNLFAASAVGALPADNNGSGLTEAGGTGDHLTALGDARLGNLDASISSRAPESGGNLATLLTRIVGTLAAGTHNPQGGDAYAIVSSETHGNAALKTLIDAIDTVVDAILADTGTDGVVVAAGSKSGYTLAASHDLYHADIELTVDEANTQDEFTVTWFKNGVRQTSGITSPLIQVIKRADGTDLVASSAMTQIGSSGSYKYDASGAERLTAGEAVVVVVTATIDGSARSFARLVGRDSTA